MKVKMMTTTKGSPNGIKVNTYEGGQEYDIPEELAVVFLKEGYGIEPPKMMRGAPSDKAAKVPEDKSSAPPEVEKKVEEKTELEDKKTPEVKKSAGKKKKKWG